MFKTRKRKIENSSIITTHELGSYILKEGVIPTPAYSRANESSYVVQPRGTIFAKIKRRKPLSF